MISPTNLWVCCVNQQGGSVIATHNIILNIVLKGRDLGYPLCSKKNRQFRDKIVSLSQSSTYSLLDRQKLCMAFCVSGAIQHLASMRDSNVIAAVNKYREAECCM
ncbi:hypothetical protein Dimus_007395 [Dionaea muscipula]